MAPCCIFTGKVLLQALLEQFRAFSYLTASVGCSSCSGLQGFEEPLQRELCNSSEHERKGADRARLERFQQVAARVRS